MPSCVALQSAHGKFVYADQGGQLHALTENIGEWEKFHVVSLGDTVVALRSIHGKYVFADPQGGIRAQGDEILEWERFNYTANSDRTVSFFSIAQNKFVYADPQGQLHALGTKIGEWEKFRITSCEVNLPSCVFLKSAHGKDVTIDAEGRLIAGSVKGSEKAFNTKFIVTKLADRIALSTVTGKFVTADPAGGVSANAEAIQAWEKYRVVTNADGTISLQSVHGKYLYADMQGQVLAAGEQIGAWEKFTVSSCSSCESRDYAIDYSQDQCSWQNGVSTMSCPFRNGTECGLRLSSLQSFGGGVFSARIKGASGPGLASNFYLYTYGRDNSKHAPWNEIDFEIIGNKVGAERTMIWTNFFVGFGRQFPQFIEVPFDASADFHTYTLDITCCSITWIVDDVVYRHVDLNMNHHADMIGAIRYSDLQVLLSLWGQTRSSGNWAEMGYLDDNMNAFPRTASFQMTQTPAVNTCKVEAGRCPP
jgi:hypothetical protein